MNTMNSFKALRVMAILFAGLVIVSCSDDDDAPAEENEVEVITDVTLIFTNVADSQDVVTASAVDPDGEGVEDLEIMGAIVLDTDKAYTLTFEILNALDPDDVEDIGDEILEEDDEHQFFFSFTDGAFGTPTGNGNIDNASDPISYEDQDDEGNPVGLETRWATDGDILSGGTFRVVLKHQPDVKSATSTSSDGDTDFDLEFNLVIQ